jgi:hypothetical protein
MKGGTAGQLADTPEHDPTPALGARARPDFRHWRTICLRRQDLNPTQRIADVLAYRQSEVLCESQQSV